MYKNYKKKKKKKNVTHGQRQLTTILGTYWVKSLPPITYVYLLLCGFWLLLSILYWRATKTHTRAVGSYRGQTFHHFQTIYAVCVKKNHIQFSWSQYYTTYFLL